LTEACRGILKFCDSIMQVLYFSPTSKLEGHMEGLSDCVNREISSKFDRKRKSTIIACLRYFCFEICESVKRRMINERYVMIWHVISCEPQAIRRRISASYSAAVLTRRIPNGVNGKSLAFHTFVIGR